MRVIDLQPLKVAAQDLYPAGVVFDDEDMNVRGQITHSDFL
jgi:hypothetical protein